MMLGKRSVNNRRARGTAMLLVLIALAMCTILALSFLAAQQPTALIASNIDRKTQARAIAESALKMAIDYVNEDADWRTDKRSGLWMSNVALDGGTFTLEGTDEADGDLANDSSQAVLLTVVASYQGVTHRVSARVTPGGQESGANRMLLIAGSGSSLSSSDSNKRDLFESWGYVVSVIDDSASQSSYNAAVAVNDVVFVSEQVDAGRVNTKLRGATIGVVNAAPLLCDDFGFSSASSRSGASASRIDIVDNTHPITSGFPVGALAFYDSPIDISYITGSMPAGAAVLADCSGRAGDANFVVADVGDTLQYGAAAGRRVIFPSTNDINVNELTTDGQLLLRRCIEWAMDETADTGASPTLLALYTFEEQAVADPSLLGHWRLDETPTAMAGGGISAGNSVEMDDAAVIDSYRSSSGTYDSQTPGSSAMVTLNSTSNEAFTLSGSARIKGDASVGAGGSTASVFEIEGLATISGARLVQDSNIEIATLSAPSGLPDPGSTDFNLSSSNTQTISSDVSYDNFTIKNSAVVTINGDITIWVKGDLVGKGDAKLVIPEGSSLTLYVGGDFAISGDCEFNADSAGTSRLTLYGYGEKEVGMAGRSVMAATVYTNDSFHVKDSTHFYGTVLADEGITAEGSAAIHHDLSQAGFSVSGMASTLFGYTAVGNRSQALDRDAAAMSFTLTEALTVASLTAYVNGGEDGGKLRMAIYDDGSSAPGSLLAQTSKLNAPEEAWQWVTGSLTSLTLSPGTYWLALSLDSEDNDARYGYQSGGSNNTQYHSMNAVGDGFNSTWGSSSGSGSRQLCIYASGSVSGDTTMPNAIDEATLGNGGTYVGDASGAAGGFGDGGTSVQFDGDGDYLEIQHDSAYLLDRGSVGLHFNADRLGGEQALFSKDANDIDRGGHLHLYADGNRLKARIQTSSNDPYRTGS